jgi:hypothetical protein
MTSDRRNPQEKKALAYRKDHEVQAEFPHAFRRQWPRNKARSQRAFRRRVQQLLAQVHAVPTDEDDASGAIQAEAFRRKQVRKWGVITLRERVEAAYEQRICTTAWNFFKKPYRREEHRERFAAFLETITASITPYLRDVACFLGDVLDGTDALATGRHVYQPLPSQRAWLHAFLADEPAWESRMRTWIERATGRTPS